MVNTRRSRRSRRNPTMTSVLSESSGHNQQDNTSTTRSKVKEKKKSPAPTRSTRRSKRKFEEDDDEEEEEEEEEGNDDGGDDNHDGQVQDDVLGLDPSDPSSTFRQLHFLHPCVYMRPVKKMLKRFSRKENGVTIDSAAMKKWKDLTEEENETLVKQCFRYILARHMNGEAATINLINKHICGDNKRYQGLGRILVAETQVKFLRILGLDLFESIDSDFAYQLNHVEGYLKWGKQKDDKPKRRKKKRKSGNDSNEEVTRFVEYCNWDLDNDEMRKDEDGPRLSVINRNEQSGHIVLVNRVKAWQKKLEDVTDDAMEANDKHYRVLAGASINGDETSEKHLRCDMRNIERSLVLLILSVLVLNQRAMRIDDLYRALTRLGIEKDLISSKKIVEDTNLGIKDLKGFIERDLVTMKYLTKKFTNEHGETKIKSKQESSNTNVIASRDGKISWISIGERSYAEIGLGTMYDFVHKILGPEVHFDKHLLNVFEPQQN